PRLRNSDCDPLIESCAIQFYPTTNSIPRAFLELDKVILHKRAGHLQKLHLARESAIVPPMRHQRRHSVSPALVIYFDNKEIGSVSDEPGYFKIERRESALVLPDFFPVEINIRAIICRPEINEET